MKIGSRLAAIAALLISIALPLRSEVGRIGLSGEWRFRIDPQDRGVPEKWWESRLPERIRLPGSLQEQRFGDEVTADTEWVAGWGVERQDYPDWRTHPMFEKYRRAGNLRFPYWLQPKKHYLGLAWYQRDVEIPAAWNGKRITLYLERCHWKTWAWVDGRALGDNDSLGAPHVYELAGIAAGRHTITLAVDNRMIYPVGVNAHSVGDQTQTTWNGIVGTIELRASDPVWIEDVQIYPDVEAKRARLRVAIGNLTGKAQSGSLTMRASVFNTRQPQTLPSRQETVKIGARKFTEVELEYPLGEGARRWDEFSPALYRMQVRMGSSETEVSFGLREIKAQGTSLAVNGRKLFLRGTLECAVFPLTGYPPTDVAAWKRIMRTVKSYGLNHLRFHSWFPPEAAFVAADEEGVYLHAECHLWSSVTAKTPELHAYLMRESQRLLRQYGNHPSFAMFGLGNESWVEEPLLTALLLEWKKDPRRVYTGPANANASMIPEYDYYIGREIEKKRIRYQSGWPPVPENVWFLDRPPQTTVDFREAVELYGKPLLAHETVQRCSYPDLNQTRKYTGSLKAAYLDIARDQLIERGMLGQARDFVQASGKWQVQQFKEEIEASLRTPGLGGFQLLDLHDFPGQGAALVGVLDAFWDSKGYVTPAEFTRFANSTVPLARMAKRTWTTAEVFTASLEIAHFGPATLDAVSPEWRIVDAAGKQIAGARLKPARVTTGGLTVLGDISLSLARLSAPAKYRLLVRAAGHENDWDFWLYPSRVNNAIPKDVIVTTQLDDGLVRRLEAGATVLLAPPKENIRGKLRQCFTSIYWNAPWTNGGESETMGILTDPTHPVFREFPTESHSNWQWFELLSTARPMILDAWGDANPWPKHYRPLIQLVDDWNQNRKLAVLAEGRLGAGKLMICALDIETDLETRIVARQFRRSLLDYMRSAAFQPAAELTVAQIRGVLQERLAATPGRPEYPLYSPFFGSSHSFSPADLKAIATTFDFVYGQALTKEEMEAARRVNPRVQFIKYVGAWTVRANAAGHGLREQILYYPCATLAQDVDASQTEFTLAETPERPLSLKKSTAEYVLWIRIGDELMRLEAFDSAAKRVRVVRGFDDGKAQPHRRGDRVFSPAYGVAPGKPNEFESGRNISYHYDPAYPARWNYIYDTLTRFVSEGGDGIWIDILMDRSLRESDVDGQELRGAKAGFSATWDFAAGRPYRRDEFRQKNEIGVRGIQERFKKKFGRYPVIYANNMMASRYEAGQGGHKFYLLSTPEKPRPIDGMCIEDFMGGYESEEWAQWSTSRTPSVPKKACYPCDTGYKNWAENVKMLMRSAQAGMHAIPLIINAGMKTAIFEAIDRKARHEWELWAYASYLLGVEKKNGECPTKLGVPMFYRDGERRYVAIDPMYYWRIGEPAETVKPEDLARYRIGTTEVYRRRFSNGVVLVNPAARPQQIQLEHPLTDPYTGEQVRAATLEPRSGKILLSLQAAVPNAAALRTAK